MNNKILLIDDEKYIVGLFEKALYKNNFKNIKNIYRHRRNQNM